MANATIYTDYINYLHSSCRQGHFLNSLRDKFPNRKLCDLALKHCEDEVSKLTWKNRKIYFTAALMTTGVLGIVGAISYGLGVTVGVLLPHAIQTIVKIASFVFLGLLFVPNAWDSNTESAGKNRKEIAFLEREITLFTARQACLAN